MIQNDLNSATRTKQKIKHQDDSFHKIIANEVPNWDNVTLDEGATLLKRQICYFNEEREYFYTKFLYFLTFFE